MCVAAGAHSRPRILVEWLVQRSHDRSTQALKDSSSTIVL